MEKILKRLPNTVSMAALLYIIAMVLLAPNVSATNDDEYQSLLARMKNGDNVDYTQLRQAYAKSPDYDPYSINIGQLKSDMHEAASRGNCESALESARRILETHFLSIDAHAAAAHCYEKLGRDEQVAQEWAVARGLIQSIFQSGDGKTPETAFIVVTLEEQYTLMSAMQLQRRSKSLIHHDGHVYDMHEVIRRDAAASDTTTELYFRVDPIIGHLDKQLGTTGNAAPSKND